MQLPNAHVKNFTSNWRDGQVLAQLINALQPNLVESQKYHTPFELSEACISAAGTLVFGANRATHELAAQQLDVAAILAAQHITTPNVDEYSVIAYINQFRTWALKKHILTLEGLATMRCRTRR